MIRRSGAAGERRSSRALRHPCQLLLLLLLLLAGAADAAGFVLPGPFVLARCRERLAALAGTELLLEVDEAGDVYRETLAVDRQGLLRHAARGQRVGTDALRELLGGGLLRLLAQLGVDTSRSALSRLDGRVVIVVGALAGETERPQLWVDQETFFPVRLKAGGRDLVLRELFSPLTGGRFPRLIQVFEQGRLLWQAQVIRIGPSG